MAEHDPVNPPDATELAYREALLASDTDREQRRLRLMAALPRPDAVVAPVSRAELAWRWRPYALGVLATGLLLAVVFAWKGQPSAPKPMPRPDARMAATQPTAPASVNSEATVVAQATPPAVPKVVAPASPRNTAKATRQKPRPEVLADAGTSRPGRESEAFPTPPAATPPAAPAIAAAPALAAPMPAAKAVAERAEPAPLQAEAPARSVTSLRASAAQAGSLASSLAASDGAEPTASQALGTANASLLSAVTRGDAPAARAALQAGASVNARDAQGRTALMLAARAGSREMVSLLLSAGARKADRDAQGWTAADHAQDQGHGDLAERLR